jgi:hypothetical protein
MNTNQTLVSTFVADFNKVTNETTKRGVIQKHIKRHYAPLMEKTMVLNLMNDKSIAEGKHGRYINLTTSKLNLVMAILALYTDLMPDKTIENDKEVVKSYESYDLLKESGALDMIIVEIGEDIQELLTIQSEVMDTWTAQNCSTAAFISDLVEKVSMIFSTALGKELGSITDIFNELPAEQKQNFFAMLKDNFKK